MAELKASTRNLRFFSSARPEPSETLGVSDEESVLPTGDLAGKPEDALDTARGHNLGDPTAWM